MASTRTRRELVDQALSVLGVLTPGNAPSAEDVAAVDDHLDGLLDQLDAREIVSGIDPDEIEPRFFYPLAVCLAEEAREEFGAAAIDVTDAENKLRQMNRSGPTYEPLKVDYF